MKSKIKGWTRNYYGEKKQRKTSLIKELHRLGLLQESRSLSDLEYLQWASLKAQLDNIYLQKETYWKNRSKQQWSEERDHNTKFFHVVASHRCKKNRINSLEIYGTSTTNLGDMKKHAIEFYRKTTEREWYQICTLRRLILECGR